MKLTPANLITIARQARHHIYGVETPPQTVEELLERRRRLIAGPGLASAWLHVFGPSTGLRAKPYDVLFAVGLSDYEAPSSVNYNGPRDTVHTIEEHLAEELRRHPSEAGFDCVVVLHERPADGAELWQHAAKVDADARACLRRVRTSATSSS